MTGSVIGSIWEVFVVEEDIEHKKSGLAATCMGLSVDEKREKETGVLGCVIYPMFPDH